MIDWYLFSFSTFSQCSLLTWHWMANSWGKQSWKTCLLPLLHLLWTPLSCLTLLHLLWVPLSQLIFLDEVLTLGYVGNTLKAHVETNSAVSTMAWWVKIVCDWVVWNLQQLRHGANYVLFISLGAVGNGVNTFIKSYQDNLDPTKISYWIQNTKYSKDGFGSHPPILLWPCQALPNLQSLLWRSCQHFIQCFTSEFTVW